MAVDADVMRRWRRKRRRESGDGDGCDETVRRRRRDRTEVEEASALSSSAWRRKTLGYAIPNPWSRDGSRRNKAGITHALGREFETGEEAID